jgi:hypothetical protein
VHTKRPFNDVRAGETFTATATLKNAASRAAAGVRTTIVLPRGTRLVGTPPRSCRLVAAGVSCDVGTIAGNGKRVLRLRLRSVAGGHVDLRARASTATQKRLSARASVTAPNGAGCTIYGTTPVVLGTPGDDVICLSPGFHLVLAGTGDDIVYGRSGRQVIYGGAGNDVLYGDADDDYLDGGPGRDLLEGGRGDDKLLGRADDDRLRGGGGRDRLHGGVDADVALADADDLVFEVESGDGGWRTGTHGAAQLIVKRGSR